MSMLTWARADRSSATFRRDSVARLLSKVPVKNIKQFESEFITMLRNKHNDVLEALKKGDYSDQITGTLEKVAADLVKSLDN